MTRVTGLAAAMLEDGIDTDVIFPARFLLRMEKKGLGECLFADRKLAGLQQSRPLERPDGRPVQILFAGAQFGCGSSREHAVWAMVDHGFRAVIAPSFGEIFATNAARNGLALITLEQDQIETLLEESRSGELTIDFAAMTIISSAGIPVSFRMPEEDRQAIMNGWDQIDLIEVEHHDQIETFEAAYRERRPWLPRDVEPPIPTD